jgi:hypothetical protein
MLFYILIRYVTDFFIFLYKFYFMSCFDMLWTKNFILCTDSICYGLKILFYVLIQYVMD